MPELPGFGRREIVFERVDVPDRLKPAGKDALFRRLEEIDSAYLAQVHANGIVDNLDRADLLLPLGGASGPIEIDLAAV